MVFNTLASDIQVQATKVALEKNGITVFITQNKTEAKEKVLELLPIGAEVLSATSVTLSQIGLDVEINETDKYDSVKKRLISMDRSTQNNAMQKLGSAPEWVVGSVHAVTSDGVVMVASHSGSQLASYSYGAQNVIWVVGTHKIVADLRTAQQRINEYCLPLESERAKKAYGVDGSNIRKEFILHRETNPGRITIILVKEVLGF